MNRMAMLGLATGFVVALSGAASAQTTVRVGWCARTISSAGAPFAIATKYGWFAESGIKIQLVPLPGSTDCVKLVATGEVAYSLPSVEPLAIIRPQGVKAKIFYTAYQGNIYGIRVPADGPVKTFADLKGKKIGVTSMASGGVLIARALAAISGLDPDKDITIVVAGEGAQTAALLRSNQIDALSQFDTQYALAENAGAKLRRLENKEVAKYPSNGFVALEETLRTKTKEAIALAQGYARGTVFAIANPEAAIRVFYEVYPDLRPLGKDEETAIRDDLNPLRARIENWKLEAGGVSRWGESSQANYAAYIEFMLKWGVIKERVDVNDVITNDLIPEIGKFDIDKTVALAKAYK